MKIRRFFKMNRKSCLCGILPFQIRSMFYIVVFIVVRIVIVIKKTAVNNYYSVMKRYG